MRIIATIAFAAALATSGAAMAQTMPSEADRMAAFTANDKNKDGKLDKTEYAALLTGFGAAQMADQLFGFRDTNKDGFISLEEYKASLPQQ
jgi:hypothetical protein